MSTPYKSQKSDKFKSWLWKREDESAWRKKVELLADLEKFSRMLIHDFDISGEIRPQDIHNLARASKKLEAEYEESATG